MTLARLNDAVLFTRMGSFGFCFLALLMHFCNAHVVLNVANRCSLLSMMIQAVVIATELIALSWFGFAAALPNHLGWSLMTILVDCLAAIFAMTTGLMGIGVFILQSSIHVCPISCMISLFYTLLVFTGGAFGGSAAMCSIIIAARMNLQRQAQD